MRDQDCPTFGNVNRVINTKTSGPFLETVLIPSNISDPIFISVFVKVLEQYQILKLIQRGAVVDLSYLDEPRDCERGETTAPASTHFVVRPLPPVSGLV